MNEVCGHVAASYGRQLSSLHPALPSEVLELGKDSTSDALSLSLSRALRLQARTNMRAMWWRSVSRLRPEGILFFPKGGSNYVRLVSSFFWIGRLQPPVNMLAAESHHQEGYSREAESLLLCVAHEGGVPEGGAPAPDPRRPGTRAEGKGERLRCRSSRPHVLLGSLGSKLAVGAADG